MSEKPDSWAYSRVADLEDAEGTGTHAYVRIKDAFARYIALHEQPPVDPDVIAVREILGAYSDVAGCDNGTAIRAGEWDDSPDLQIPLSVYLKHKEAGK